MDFPRGDEQTQAVGTWWTEGKRELDELFSIVARCPGCSKVWAIYHELNGKILGGQIHTIAENGTVNPSAVCPFKPCAFHEWIRLLDYHGEQTNKT